MPSKAKQSPEPRPINFTLLESCPKCEANWRGEPIPEKSRYLFGDARWFSRVIGISSLQQDRTIAWQCPDCDACWDRDTGKPRSSFKLGRLCSFIFLSIALSSLPAVACNQPFPRAGRSCPLGYYVSGDYCVPFRQ